MRNYTLNIRLAAVMVAPLLLACGSSTTGGDVVTPSDCNGVANQSVTTDAKGQLVCKQLPAGAVGLTVCTPKAGEATAVTSDGTAILCDTLNVVDATTKMLLDQLTQIEKDIVDYGTQIVTLQNGVAAQSSYVGLSIVPNTATLKPVTGNITYTDANNVTYTGIAAASQRCVESYGKKSHMCTPYEIYYSAASLKPTINGSADITPGGWVYMDSNRHDGVAFPAPVEVTAGLADNCGGYTNDNAAGAMNQWAGTRFEFTKNASMFYVPKFYANVACSTSLPIACCR